MKCVLHIGTEKTGTTSIQRALETNREALAEEQVLYPQLFRGQDHVKISCFAMDDARMDLRKRRLDLTDERSIAAFRQSFSRDLSREIASNRRRVKTAVIVNEHLSRLKNESEVRRLKALLDELFEEVTVHLYIRRQDLLMCSMYSTVVKVGGMRENVFPRYDPERENSDFVTFDYHRMFRLWTSVVPRESFHIHFFDRATLIGGDAITDFLVRSGLSGESGAGRFVVASENASLDPMALEVLRRFNVAWREGGHERARIGGIGRIFASLFPGGGKPVSRGEAEAFLSRFEESNRALARDYFGRETLFDASDLADLPDSVAPVEPTLEDAMRIMSAAWNARFGRRKR